MKTIFLQESMTYRKNLLEKTWKGGGMTMIKDEKILQLKIMLDGIKPAIWRRFLTKDTVSFEQLHNIIQKVMGWENYHLYEFSIGGVSIIPRDEGYNFAESSFHTLFNSPEFMKMLEKGAKNGKKMDIDKMNEILKNAEKNKPKNKFDVNTRVNLLLGSEGQKFNYTYDFGDSWKHELIVEKITPPEEGKKYPLCLEGERACPPEDCGSVPGYYELMKIRKNKNHPEYKERVAGWLGEDYDPELFVADWVNAYLHGKKPKAGWMMKR